MEGLDLELTDEELAEKAQKGNIDAFTSLVRRYEKKMLRYVTGVLGQMADAEDVVQEVFLKAYRNMRSFDVKRKFSSWLYRIAHNEAINAIKKRRHDPLLFFDADTLFPHPLSAEKTDQAVEEKELRQTLEKSLNALPPKYREPMILHYMQELGYQEIADILHVPIGTVGVRLKRAKLKLKLLIKRTGYQP